MDRAEIQRRHDAGETWAQIAGSAAAGVALRKSQAKWRARRRNQGATDEPPAPPAAPGSDDVRVVEARQRWTVEQMAAAHGLDLAEWVCTRFQPGRWQQGQKDGDGNPVVVCLESARATFERLPQWVTLKPIEPGVVIPPPEATRVQATDTETVLLVPDMQVGLSQPRLDPTRRPGALVPMHHRAGIALMVQVVQALQPDRIIFLGDDFDAAEWSTYGHGLGADGMTAAALYELHYIYEQTRLAAPSARIDCIQGNHGYRIEREVQARLKAASQLCRVGETTPVWSIPSLLSLEALHIDYHGPYKSPAGNVWLWREHPRLRTLVTHGRVAARAGGLAAKIMPGLGHSHWQGHDHTAQIAHRALHDLPGGSRVVTCATPGMLCRRDGEVPSSRGGDEDWTSALGIIRRQGDRASHALIPVQLDDYGREASCWLGASALNGDAAGYEERLVARWPGFRWVA